MLFRSRATFDALHGAVENLPVEQLIPVPGHADAPPLDYEFVRSLEWKGETEFVTKGAQRGETITVNVREALDGVRGEARKQRDDEQREAARPGGEVHYHQHKHMGDSFNVTGDGNAVGKDIRQKIEGSFNTNPDVTALLTALRGEMDKLPAADVEKVRPYVEAIEMEAKKEKPSRGFLEMTKNGMVEAAKTCAEMAPSLVSAASAVVGWFSK